MPDNPCPHGYVPGSCAECRAAGAGPRLLDSYRSQHAGKSRTELDAERGRCIARSAELSGYGRLSGAQVQEADSLIAEQIVLDDLIARDDVAARSESIARGRAAMADPGNREGRPGRRRWCTGSVTGGRPRPRRSSG